MEPFDKLTYWGTSRQHGLFKVCSKAYLKTHRTQHRSFTYAVDNNPRRYITNCIHRYRRPIIGVFKFHQIQILCIQTGDILCRPLLVRYPFAHHVLCGFFKYSGKHVSVMMERRGSCTLFVTNSYFVIYCRLNSICEDLFIYDGITLVELIRFRLCLRNLIPRFTGALISKISYSPTVNMHH